MKVSSLSSATKLHFPEPFSQMLIFTLNSSFKVWSRLTLFGKYLCVTITLWLRWGMRRQR